MNMQAEDKTVAILSYITPIGWIIGLILHSNNKTELGAFHLRQTLGLFILWIIAWILFSIIPVIGWMMYLIIFVFWLLGLIYAVQGEKKAVPLIGDFIQNLFKGIN